MNNRGLFNCMNCRVFSNLLVLSFFFVFVIDIHQCMKVFSGKFEGDENVLLYDIASTSDNQLIAVGTTNSFGCGVNDCLILMKFTNEGNVTWTRLFSSDEDIIADELRYFNDSVLLVGRTRNSTILVKTDNDGSIVYQKSWNYSSGHISGRLSFFVIPYWTYTGEISICGTYTSDSTGYSSQVCSGLEEDMETFKFEKSLASGGNTFDVVGGCDLYSTGQTIFTGHTYNPGLDKSDITIFGLHFNGNKYFYGWLEINSETKVEGQSVRVIAQRMVIGGVIKSQERHTILAASLGASGKYEHGNRDHNQFVKKIDFKESVQTKPYGCQIIPSHGHVPSLFGLDYRPFDHIICVGSVLLEGRSVYDLYFVKLSASGKFLWAKVLSNPNGNDTITSLRISNKYDENEHSHLLAIGQTTLSDGRIAGYFAVLDFEGMTCGLEDITNQTNVTEIETYGNSGAGYNLFDIGWTASNVIDRNPLMNINLIESSVQPNQFVTKELCYGCGDYMYDSEKVCNGPKNGYCHETNRSCVCTRPNLYFGDDCSYSTQFTESIRSSGEGDDYPGDAIESNDGNIIAVGTTKSFGYSEKQILISEVKRDGQISWTRTYERIDGNSIDEVTNIIELDSDGNFIISFNIINPKSTFGLMKIDSSTGSRIWDFIHDDLFANSSVVSMYEEPTDQTVIVIGNMFLEGVYGNDGLLAKFNVTDGSIIWSKRIGVGNETNQVFLSASRAPISGNIIVCGSIPRTVFPSRTRGMIGIFSPIDGSVIHVQEMDYYHDGNAEWSNQQIDQCISFSDDGWTDSVIGMGFFRVKNGYMYYHTSRVDFEMKNNRLSRDFYWGQEFVGYHTSHSPYAGRLDSINMIWDGNVIVGGRRGTDKFNSGYFLVRIAKSTGQLHSWYFGESSAYFEHNLIRQQNGIGSVSKTSGNSFIFFGSSNSSNNETSWVIGTLDREIQNCIMEESSTSHGCLGCNMLPILPTIYNWTEFIVVEDANLQSLSNTKFASDYSLRNSTREEIICLSCTGKADELNGPPYTCNRCFGKLWNENSCSGHGLCIGEDKCLCDERFNGSECDGCKYDYHYTKYCNESRCFDKLYNDQDVCSGFGTCIDLNVCLCFDGYYGKACNITTCQGKFSNESDTCTVRGICFPKDECNCANYYYGEHCNITECFGFFSNDSLNVCDGHGECILHDNCVCSTPNKFFGKFCNDTYCDGIQSNDSNVVCNGHGLCYPNDTCSCSPNYFGYRCNITTCFSILSNDSSMSYCSNHGVCKDLDLCECHTNSHFYGEVCEVTTCFGIFSNDTTNVCNGDGNCTDYDVCVCDLGNYGDNCSVTTCFGVFSNISDMGIMCSGHGKCISLDDCDCDQYYDGSYCEINECGYIQSDNINVCSGHGNCTAHDFCVCDIGYVNNGGYCVLPSSLDNGDGGNNNNDDGGNIVAPIVISVVAVSVSAFVILGILCCICVCSVMICCCVMFVCVILCGGSSSGLLALGRVFRKKLTEQQKFVLDETNIEGEETSLAKLQINKKLFTIDIREIKLTKILGKGGSSSTVYLADFNGVEVAFKGFKTMDICGNQDTFDEFEKEVKILGSISHPFTLRFYGACLKPPRIGIVMEFCPNGDLVRYYNKSKKIDGEIVNMETTIRFLTETALAMKFLHSRGIIHRDLKNENILIDSEDHCKVMDFGCSKLVERMSKSKTLRLGTPQFMSPEIVLGEGHYSEKVDVFSYSMIIFCLLASNFMPYGNVPCVELKVANNPSYRPNMELLNETRGEEEMNELKWLTNLIMRSWDADSKSRPSFEEILKTFQQEGGLDIDDEQIETPKRSISVKELMSGKTKEKEEDEKEEDNPIIVDKSFRIMLGGSLTVMPGVEVLFSDNVGVVIDGPVYANGTENKRILFRGNSGQSWNGLVISSSKVSFEYCDFMDVKDDDYVNIKPPIGEGNPEFGDVRFFKCNFTGSSQAIYIGQISYDSRYYFNVTIDGCYFKGMTNYGVRIIYSYVTIENCIGESIGGTCAFHMYGTQTTLRNCSLVNTKCLLSQYESSSDPSDAGGVLVEDNFIESSSNPQYLLAMSSQFGDIIIRNNVFKKGGQITFNSLNDNSTVFFINNTMEDCGNYQDKVLSLGSFRSADIKVFDNTFTNSKGTVLYISSSNQKKQPKYSFENNVIVGTKITTAGKQVIYIKEVNTNSTYSIRSNIIVKSEVLDAPLIYFETNSELPSSTDNKHIFERNNITDNKNSKTHSMMYLKSDKFVFHNNLFANPEMKYEVELDPDFVLVSKPINMTFNYWGFNNITNISKRIYDWNDNKDLQVVIWNESFITRETVCESTEWLGDPDSCSSSPGGVIVEGCYPGYTPLLDTVCTLCCGIPASSSLVCNENGICLSNNSCVCYDGNYGDFCNITVCYGKWFNESGVCFNHGKCKSLDVCDCSDNYSGDYCNQTECFGVWNYDISSVCDGHGTCDEHNICQCDNAYYGTKCNFTTCLGIWNNETGFCSDHGSCQIFDHCDCVFGYLGINCNVTTCYQIFSNETDRVCSSHGECFEYNVCTCSNNYYGDYCNETKCNNVWNNASAEMICSSHGNCIDFETCECEDNYFGENCNVTICNSVYSNETNVCRGFGTCTIYEECECEENFFGDNCSVSNCFGFLSNSSGYCNDHGNCVDSQCLCDTNYGIECNVTKCNDRWNNETSVCSNHGNCALFEKCECVEDFYGEDCNITTCFSDFSNESACTGHGECYPTTDICDCHENYYGILCNITTCFDIFSNVSDGSVCSYHGICVDHNVCECVSLYHGVHCNVTECYGYLSNDSDLSCGVHGECIDANNCSCEVNYDLASDCSVWFCDDISRKNMSDVCSGRGECISHNNCSCWMNYTGDICEYFDCFGIQKDSKGVCSSHGECFDYNQCKCQTNYSDSDCSSWNCDGKDLSSELICSGHGTCISSDNCTCSESGYSGQFCDSWKCWGIERVEVDTVCYGHGYCVSKDSCFCLTGYSSTTWGGDCEEWSCGVYDRKDSSVCNQRGICISPHSCDCRDDYTGSLCEEWSCGGLAMDSVATCSGHGDCEKPNTCKCNSGFSGSTCGTNLIAIGVSVPLGSIAVFSVFLCFVMGFLCIGLFLCCILIIGCLMCSLILCLAGCVTSTQRASLNRFSELKNFDILLEEQKLDEDTSIAHLRISKSLFSVPIKEIKFVKILGEGGSQSVVYLAKWHNKDIAFKCFKTRHVCDSQEHFDEFEREVTVLGSIAHPNVIQFFGACLAPPRVGILMEFCENGDLEVFLHSFEKKGEVYPFIEKLRVLLEISTACGYIHSRSIIHRDLKLENVLIDSKEHAKLMDFGLSKIVDRMSKQKTKKIGTSFYMSPEITKTGTYDEKCDVYSYAIMVYIICTERWEPYGSGEQNVEMKVATDPDFRPNQSFLEDEEKIPKEYQSLVKQIVVTCWSHESKNRYSFDEISGMLTKGFEQKSGEQVIAISSSSHIQQKDDTKKDEEDEEENDMKVSVEKDNERSEVEKLRNEFMELLKQKDDEFEKKEKEVDEIKKTLEKFEMYFEKNKLSVDLIEGGK